MTYRPPARKRWRFPFLLCLPAVGIWLGIVTLHYLGAKETRLGLSILVLSGIAFVDLVRRSWLVWTTMVSVDDTGLRWSRGSMRQALRWNEISELGFSYTTGRRRLQIGPVRARSNMLHPLPMLPRPLYEELKSRLGGLPPAIEQDYYSRQSS